MSIDSTMISRKSKNMKRTNDMKKSNGTSITSNTNHLSLLFVGVLFFFLQGLNGKEARKKEANKEQGSRKEGTQS